MASDNQSLGYHSAEENDRNHRPTDQVAVTTEKGNTDGALKSPLPKRRVLTDKDLIPSNITRFGSLRSGGTVVDQTSSSKKMKNLGELVRVLREFFIQEDLLDDDDSQELDDWTVHFGRYLNFFHVKNEGTFRNQRFRVLHSEEVDDTHLVSHFNTDPFVTCLESYRELSCKLALLDGKRYLTGETDVLLVKRESEVCNDTTTSGHLLSASGGNKKAEVEDVDVPKYVKVSDSKEWSDKVVSAFKMKGAHSYLVDEDACRLSPDVSEAYVVKLLAALDSSELAYIAEEEKNSKVCSKVWETITDSINSTSRKFDVTLSCYKKLLNAQCNSREEFSLFFSDYRKNVARLKECGSQAVDDDIFMRALLFHGIAIKDDSDELKKLISDKEDHAYWMTHFKKRYAALSDESKLASGKARRVTEDQDGKRNKKKAKVTFEGDRSTTTVIMPPNDGLPDSVYQNMVCWLKITQKPKHQRTEKDKAAFERATKLLTRMAENSKAVNDRKRSEAKARRAEAERQDAYHDQTVYPTQRDQQSGWQEDYYRHRYQHEPTAGGRGTDINVRRLTDGSRGRGGRGGGGRGPPSGGRGRGAYAYNHIFSGGRY